MEVIASCIYICFIICFFIMSIKKKNSKALNVVFVILCFILMAGNSGSGDVVNYKRSYDRALESGTHFEFIFYQFERICNILHFSFFEFKFIYYLCFIVLLIKFIFSNSPLPCYVFAFYGMFGMFYDAEQMRNAVGAIIFCLSISTLAYEEHGKVIKYIVLVAVAALFHQSFWIYLIFLFIYVDKKVAKKIAVATASISLLVCVYMFANNNQLPLLNVFLNFFSGNIKIVRLLQARTSLGFLVPFTKALMSALAIIIPTHLIQKSVESSKVLCCIAEGQRAYVNIMYKINVISFVFFPLYMLSTETYRFSRNLLLPNLVAQSILVRYLPKKNRYRILIIGLQFITMLYWFYWDIGIKMDEILIPLFRDNIYWLF